MSFLERISLIRRLSNGQDYSYIGNSKGENIFFFNESKTRFGCIADVAIAKEILGSNSFEALDHLSSFINETDKEELYYILLFLSLSPEFSDNNKHKEKSARTQRILKNFLSACKKVNSKELALNVKQKLAGINSYSSLYLANTFLAQYFTMAGKYYFNNKNFLFLNEHITEKYGFFNAAPRITKLKAFNADIKEHLNLCQFKHPTEDDIFMVLLLRIMGSAPLSATITACCNDLIKNKHRENNNMIYEEKEKLSAKDYFNAFLPTRFVLRRAISDATINSYNFIKNDVLFVYLASTKNCPLRKLHNLPFGFGVHTCPGRKISEHIVKTIIDVIDNNLLKKAQLIPQKPQNAGAFLSFGEE